ncbi:hypothetical protein [Yoonia sp.]|uniref:hypothetical protein n=1 Tax=Yoonia sp. TaxID=2212373 RepID=UPI003F6D2422
MTKSEESLFTDLVQQVRAVMVVNPMIHPQIVQFWTAQEKFLQEAETFTAGWFARRHDAVDTALDVVDAMTGNGASDPSAVTSAMADWMHGSMQRMSEDAREWIELCAHCTGDTLSAELEVEKETIEKTADQLKASTKKHAMPV